MDMFCELVSSLLVCGSAHVCVLLEALSLSPTSGVFLCGVLLRPFLTSPPGTALDWVSFLHLHSRKGLWPAAVL